MNVIFSLWTKPCTNGKAHGFTTVQDMINSLILAVNVAKRNYENIHFYTDKLGMEWITPHLSDLPFTKIEVCLDELDWLDDKYWSLVKLYVYNLQKEPFFHIDNDVYLWDKFPDEFVAADFFFQEVEYFNEMGRDFYIRGLKVYQDALPKGLKIPDAAFNCGIFGCSTQKGLNILQSYYEIGVEFVNNTKDLPNLDYESQSDRWLATVIIEQVVIYSLVHYGGFTYNVLLHHNDEYMGYRLKHKIKYTHTLAHHKRHPRVAERVAERVKFKDWNA